MSLAVVDGTQEVLEDIVGGVLYSLQARVDAILARDTTALLGPALNALYAQALIAALADPTLGGLATDVREGATGGDREALGLDVEISRDGPGAATGGFGLHLNLLYWQPTGIASKREPILAALTAAVTANVPGPGLCIRERVLSTFHAHLASILAPLEVLRNADRPLRVQDGDRVVLLDGDQGVEHVTLGRTDCTAQPTVEVFVAGTSAAALDARMQQVRDAIRSADTVLRSAGLAEDVEEGDADPEILREAYTGPAMGAVLGVRIRYATVEGQPYEAPA